MSELVWEEPPEPRRGLWRIRLLPLMDHPNRWAMVHEFDRSTTAQGLAKSLSRGATKTPPGRWEFAGRQMDDGTGRVYARYLGE